MRQSTSRLLKLSPCKLDWDRVLRNEKKQTVNKLFGEWLEETGRLLLFSPKTLPCGDSGVGWWETEKESRPSFRSHSINDDGESFCATCFRNSCRQRVFFLRAAKKIAPLLVFVPSVCRRCSTSPNWWFSGVFESQPESLPLKIRSWNGGRPTTDGRNAPVFLLFHNKRIKIIWGGKHGQRVA